MHLCEILVCFEGLLSLIYYFASNFIKTMNSFYPIFTSASYLVIPLNIVLVSWC